MTTVTFFHSALCPRCRLAGHWLSKLLDEFPHVAVEKVEYLANLRRSREAGVRSIPTLVSGEQRLGGFLLTEGAIRRFLESLESPGTLNAPPSHPARCPSSGPAPSGRR